MPASWLSAMRQSAHGAVFVADVEPDAAAVVLLEPASLDHDAAAQGELVAAGLPAAVEVPGIVTAGDALGEEQTVGVARAPADLAVVLERAAAHDLVGCAEGSAAGAGLFEDAILDHVTLPAELRGSLLGRVGRVTEPQPSQLDVGLPCPPRASAAPTPRRDLRQVLVGRAPDEEPSGRLVDEEGTCAPSGRGGGPGGGESRGQTPARLGR